MINVEEVREEVTGIVLWATCDAVFVAIATSVPSEAGFGNMQTGLPALRLAGWSMPGP